MKIKLQSCKFREVAALVDIHSGSHSPPTGTFFSHYRRGRREVKNVARLTTLTLQRLLAARQKLHATGAQKVPCFSHRQGR